MVVQLARCVWPAFNYCAYGTYADIWKMTLFDVFIVCKSWVCSSNYSVSFSFLFSFSHRYKFCRTITDILLMAIICSKDGYIPFFVTKSGDRVQKW